MSEAASSCGDFSNLSIPTHLNKNQRTKIEELFKKEFGFTKVIQLLQHAGKPIVGHNMMFDVAFFLEQFIAPLPVSFVDFSRLWKSHFP